MDKVAPSAGPPGNPDASWVVAFDETDGWQKPKPKGKRKRQKTLEEVARVTEGTPEWKEKVTERDVPCDRCKTLRGGTICLAHANFAACWQCKRVKARCTTNGLGAVLYNRNEELDTRDHPINANDIPQGTAPPHPSAANRSAPLSAQEPTMRDIYGILLDVRDSVQKTNGHVHELRGDVQSLKDICRGLGGNNSVILISPDLSLQRPAPTKSESMQDPMLRHPQPPPASVPADNDEDETQPAMALWAPYMGPLYNNYSLPVDFGYADPSTSTPGVALPPYQMPLTEGAHDFLQESSDSLQGSSEFVQGSSKYPGSY